MSEDHAGPTSLHTARIAAHNTARYLRSIADMIDAAQASVISCETTIAPSTRATRMGGGQLEVTRLDLVLLHSRRDRSPEPLPNIPAVIEVEDGADSGQELEKGAGAYYTPAALLPVDPACGSGAFLADLDILGNPPYAAADPGQAQGEEPQ